MATILLIEDDAPARLVLRRMLESGNHRVIDHADGRRCEQAVEDERPDLVITNLIMPDRDGLEITRALRKAYPRLKLLVLTGEAGPQSDVYGKAARRFGADGVLLKPLRRQVLLNAVADLVGETPPAVVPVLGTAAT